MGIPKLIQTLQPFAERVILGQCSSGSNDKRSARSIGSDLLPILRIASVVIDGPSLVYHIYHRLLSFKVSFLSSPSSRLHPLQNQPAYSEINRAVLAFINYLHAHHGVEIRSIYFDGALPSSKRYVRLARLEDARRKLVDLRQLQSDLINREEGERNASSAVLVHKGSEFHAETLLRPPAPLPGAFKSLPPPPFMVPAVMEYLRSCLYPPSSETFTSSPSPENPVPAQRATLSQRHLTIQIVPSEADTYCAADSQRSGAAILTSDSDLLAYDLGLDGSVIFLNSLELSTSLISSPESALTQQALQGTRYHARSLSEGMGLTCSLQRFCFERSLDPSIGTSELKLRCQKGRDGQSGPIKEEDYKGFLRQYSTDDVLRHGDGRIEDKKNDGVGGTKLSKLQLQGLDPRLAELVVQCQSYHSAVHGSAHAEAKAAGEAEEDEEDTALNMHLPFLIEDPTRDSCWSYGREIRYLAYSILVGSLTPAITEKQRGVVRLHEYQRRGARIADLPIEIPFRFSDIDSLTRRLQQSLTEYRDLCSSFNPALTASHFWKSFALTQVTERRRQDGRATADTGWAGRYLCLQLIPYLSRSWDDVHRQASLNAVLYSLRMLAQTVLLAVEYSLVDQHTATVRALFEGLEGLPPISELMVAEDVRRSQRKEKTEDEVNLVNQGVGDFAHRQSSQPQRNGGSETSMDDLAKGSWRRAKRQRTSSERRQGRREKILIKEEDARPQGIRGGNMFAALEEVGE